LLEAVPTSPHPPSLIITGSTASVRGSAHFGTFAAGKFAVRALGQSLAREFGPQGVHVAHVVVDGVIDGPRASAYTVNEGKKDGKIDPDAVSFTSWILWMLLTAVPRLPRVTGICTRSLGRALRMSWI
jgi:NAD(P)-dependent dehydrogenase (short-subunit alcohol dehydrogenase family)